MKQRLSTRGLLAAWLATKPRLRNPAAVMPFRQFFLGDTSPPIPQPPASATQIDEPKVLPGTHALSAPDCAQRNFSNLNLSSFPASNTPNLPAAENCC